MKIDYENLRLAGERIYLRSLTEADATPEYASWLNDSAVNKFLETRAATVNDLINYIQAKNKQTDSLLLGIFWSATNKHIGNLKLEPIYWVKQSAVIGIIIGEKDFWGQGIAPEAIRLAADYAFSTLQMRALELGVIANHWAALRAYEKCGFNVYRTDKGALRHGDKVYDQIWMRLEKNK